MAAGGGVVRESRGQIVAAFRSFYGSGTNNLAESRALLDGLLVCRQIGVTKIVVRVDSKLVASWFHYKCEIPWSLLQWWHKIRELARDMDLTVAHVYRELNAPADSLAVIGLSTSSDHTFFSNFPSCLIGLTRLDRMRVPYIRNG
ncbi:Ribonuclease H domain [Macleaya cordata]|uniref:Ribonuclease H domain n=1 Tax=Macleaya cordata TaxID=56857 RepID=A0A200PY21_MACCD|nr:Ribonuclease H domain [Macleaya cordata]